MFERFTDRGRRVLVQAQEEARILGHHFIASEHVLLGLLHEQDGVAARTLKSLGVSLEAVRQKVRETVGQVKPEPGGSIPFTPKAKQVLELSLREALQLGHKGIDTEHLLLGITRQGECGAVDVLATLGIDLRQVRQEVLALMNEPGYVPNEEGAIVGDARGEPGGDVPGVSLKKDVAHAHNDSHQMDLSNAFGRVPGGRATLDGTKGYASERDNGLPAMGTPPPGVPIAIGRGLASRYDQLPAHRIRRDADFWALCRVEEEHVGRLAGRCQLDDVTHDITLDWWLGEVRRRCGVTQARLDRQQRKRLHRIDRYRHFRSNAVFQLYWNTFGSGGTNVVRQPLRHDPPLHLQDPLATVTVPPPPTGGRGALPLERRTPLSRFEEGAQPPDPVPRGRRQRPGVVGRVGVGQLADALTRRFEAAVVATMPPSSHATGGQALARAQELPAGGLGQGPAIGGVRRHGLLSDGAWRRDGCPGPSEGVASAGMWRIGCVTD